jgi:7-cyano-7-deazaguanine synthase in queuosine biosynthesis
MTNKTIFRGLIPFSGGIDSTAVLYSTLTKYPNDKFLVFKINLINGSSASRTIQEIAAADKILHNLRARGINNFEFKSLEFNYASLGPPPVWDSEVVNYGAAICIKAYPSIYEFYEGAIADDFLQEGFFERLDLIEKIFYAISQRSKEEIKIVFPLKEKLKYEVMKLLPPEILQLTWSCRNPQGMQADYSMVRCHKCQPCTIINNVIKNHPNEFTVLENW